MDPALPLVARLRATEDWLKRLKFPEVSCVYTSLRRDLARIPLCVLGLEVTALQVELPGATRVRGPERGLGRKVSGI